MMTTMKSMSQANTMTNTVMIMEMIMEMITAAIMMTTTAATTMTTNMPGAPTAAGFAAVSPAGGAAWTERQFRAMNTNVSVLLYSTRPSLARYVETTFARSEQRLSRFRADSELSLLNRSERPEQHVSHELFAVLEAAQWAASSTQGLFDPTILPSLERAGYDRSFEEIAADQTTPTVAGWRADGSSHSHFTMKDVVLDRNGCRVRRPCELRLDLGGIGKGWTVDRCADLLYKEGPFLLNAGGDLYAHGTPGPVEGWRIEIEDALDPTASVASVMVSNGAVATSTVVKRRWQRDAHTLHHIIDPRTGRPATTDLLTVTVLAPRTTIAEVYAKSVLILGSRSGLDFLARRGVDGLLQAQDGTLYATGALASRLIAPSHGRRIQTVH